MIIAKWLPIDEYDKGNFDWVLLKYTIDNDFECIPIVAEKCKRTGRWKALSVDSDDVDLDSNYINFKPLAFCDMQTIAEKHDNTSIQTNGDHIRSLDNTQLSKFLQDNGMVEGVWADWFSENFCGQCPTEMVKIADTDKEMPCAPCELGNDWCSHCDDSPIDVWLNASYDEKYFAKT